MLCIPLILYDQLNMKNYYQVLGLTEDATQEEIKSAYKRYALKFHPDKHDGDSFFKERFQEIQEAYSHLKKDDNCFYDDVPQIISFSLSSDEIVIKSEVTLSWEARFASYVCISIKTTNGIKTYTDLPSKGDMVITPYSQDMNVGLTITAKNNISEVVSNRLIHLKYPSNQFEDSKALSVYIWVILIVSFLGILGFILSEIIK